MLETIGIETDALYTASAGEGGMRDKVNVGVSLVGQGFQAVSFIFVRGFRDTQKRKSVTKICTVCGNMCELFGFCVRSLKPLIYKGFIHSVLFVLVLF